MNNKPCLLAPLLAAACVLSPKLFASEESMATLSEADFFGDIPVVLTATRLAQPVNEAPAAMTIIDRQLIEASGARELVDVFKLVPGFQVQHENGHTPIVTYHGMSDQYSRYMQVLVDGRTIYNPSVGGVEWSHIPLVLDDIERIEVTRGPNAASYGSNAFTATINIITRHAAETTGTFARLTAGSPNQVREGVLRVGDTSGDLDYRLTVAYQSDEGFEGRHDPKRAGLARFRSDYSISAKDTLQFQAGYNGGPRGLDFGDPAEFPERRREKETEYHFEQVRWTHSLSNSSEVQVQYFHNYHKVDETDEYDLTESEAAVIYTILGITPPAVYDPPLHQALFNSLKTHRHDLEIQHTLVPNDELRIAWGGSVRQDQWYAPGLITSNDREDINQYRIFANGEWKLAKNYAINAGAMWEKSDLTGKSVSPRLAFQHQINPQNSLRILASKATRIPTMIEYDGELTYHFTGGILPFEVTLPFLRSTADLKNETIISREIGLRSNFHQNMLSTDIKIFRDRIKDIIFFDDSAGYVVARNGENVTIRGVELQADAKPTEKSRLLFSYAHIKIISDDLNQKYSETAPTESFSLLLSQRFKNGLNASLMFYHAFQSNGLGDGNKIPPQARADIRLAMPLQLNNMKGEAAFVAENISGKEYTDWRWDDTYENRYFVTLSGQWD
jgi:iron complex outermembrane receptor protein